MQSVTRQIEGGPGAIHVPQLSFEELWEGLSGVVLRDGRPVLSMQGAPDPRESERVQGRRIHDRAGSILVAPIRGQRVNRISWNSTLRLRASSMGGLYWS